MESECDEAKNVVITQVLHGEQFFFFNKYSKEDGKGELVLWKSQPWGCTYARPAWYPPTSSSLVAKSAR